MSDVTRVLSAIEQGDPKAADQLLPLVYGELRKLAAQKLAQEKPGQTLQATALVHEAYLRLLDGDQARDWNGRGRFFAAAAEAMRRILVDRARHKKSRKAGGGRRRQELPDIELAGAGPSLDLLALHEALTKLEQHDPRRAELVKLRFFAGLTIAEAARALGVSASTADNDWVYVRSWLRVELGGRAGGGGAPEGGGGNRPTEDGHGRAEA
jgi:RNA polymerase sigma factor (TIGR02999 family)